MSGPEDEIPPPLPRTMMLISVSWKTMRKRRLILRLKMFRHLRPKPVAILAQERGYLESGW
eukprot:4017988-Amphidinium_carterae.1